MLIKLKNALTSRKTGTIIRTILHWLSIANEVVALLGKESFAQAEWYQWMSICLLVLFTTLTWWYNEDFTKFATLGSRVLDALKDGKVTIDEVEHLIDDTPADCTDEVAK